MTRQDRSPDLTKRYTVLVTVKTASRRLRRWPAANLDRRSARRSVILQAGRDGETAFKPNRETAPKKLVMMLRSFQLSDLDALYSISLATGLAGADASHLYVDRKLMGHIYSAPYALLEPELTLLVEDSEGVAGFVVGTTNTFAWEESLERDWWPALREQYADPSDTPAELRTSDQRRSFMIHRPELTPSAIAKMYPAHLHLNLLPRLQGRGVGVELAGAWFELAVRRGVSSVHVAVNRTNTRAARFWKKLGFAELTSSDTLLGRTVWMGRTLRGVVGPSSQ